MSYLVETGPANDTRSEVVPSGTIPTIIQRIEEAVDIETAAIKTDVNFDLKASNARKSRYLYELNRATRDLDPDMVGAETRSGLARLREKLELNERAILAHLNAVKEVATMVQDAIQHSENDGTYSAYEFGKA